jgi:hypothetical protein
VVLVEEELLDLLPNFLIATDRNTRVDHRISIQISRSRGFKFPIGATRRAATSPTAFGHSEGHPARNATDPQSAAIKKFHPILNLFKNLT